MDSGQHTGRVAAWLGSARLFWTLAGVNLLIAVAVAVATAHTLNLDDRSSYLGLAEGLRYGRYSAWYFLPDYLPDTFRNPGYPLFLFLLQSVGLAEQGIHAVQVGLYLATVGLIVRVAAQCEPGPNSWLARNVFLLLLIPNIQLAYLAAYIYPEVLVAFSIALYGTVALTWPTGWKRTVTLGLVAGLVFQLRPVFIFFPLAQVLLDFWQSRGRHWAYSWGQAAALLLVFGSTMLPYAFWNHRHHGVFKPTSLEGGAGVMQIGFWALRMPGYAEGRYWGNRMGDEVISFAAPATVPAHIAAFNREWDLIDAQSIPLMTARDRRYKALMHHYLPPARPEYGYLFPTYSSAYTLRREQLLMQANVADILREPGYYLKTRLYTLVRLWVTGIQRPAWQAAATPLVKIKIVYPALVSGLTFLLAVLGIAWGVRRRGVRDCLPTWRFTLALVAYFGLVHLPFAIQARYTVPVRLWLLLVVALAASAWLTRRAAPAASL